MFGSKWQRRRTLAVSAVVAGLLCCAGTARGEEPKKAEEPRKLVAQTHSLNKLIPSLDGQWQGTTVASDGCCYFGSSSHTSGQGAALFKFDPAAGKLTMLAPDMSKVCGEDPAKLPPQGKIHSDIAEHKGWLYLGTHLSIYNAEFNTAYTGGHLVGCELATGKLKDFGLLRANHSIYSGLAVDAPRDRLYVFTTPSAGNTYFYGGGTPVADEGPRIWRVDLRTGAKEELGKVGEGGDACLHLFVDGQGNCWFVPLRNLALFCARSDSGKVERHDLAKEMTWRWAAAHPDGQRAVVMAAGDRSAKKTLYVFDPRKKPAEAFDKLAEIGDCYSTTLAGGRVYFTQSRDGGRGSDHLCSLAVDPPGAAQVKVHGAIVDQDGRKPQRLGGIAADGKGRIFFVGDWFKLPGETGSIRGGKERETVHLFAVADVPADAK